MKKLKTLIILLLILLQYACSNNGTSLDQENYTKDYQEWQQSRLERLKSENGYLNLAGLFWLKEGENTFGSDASNRLKFPNGFPPYGGMIVLQDSVTLLVADTSAGITVNGEVVADLLLADDNQQEPTLMEQGPFRWFVIRRGEQYGIRLRNLEHPRLSQLDHIPAFPLNRKWVIEADYIPYDSSRLVEVPTVIEAYTETYKVSGELQFRVKGKKYSLIPFVAGNGLFLIIGDATNGMETYGAGRFLYIPEVEGSRVTIDFNRAYNPPCAFSPYATCPLPPMENILDLRIEAGEMAVHFE